MDHTILWRTLPDLLDGVATPAQEAELKQHLASCGPCQAQYADLMQEQAELGHLHDRGLDRAIQVGLEATEERPAGPWRGLGRHVARPKLLALAVGLVAFTAAALLVAYDLRLRAEVQGAIVAMQAKGDDLRAQRDALAQERRAGSSQSAEQGAAADRGPASVGPAPLPPPPGMPAGTARRLGQLSATLGGWTEKGAPSASGFDASGRAVVGGGEAPLTDFGGWKVEPWTVDQSRALSRRAAAALGDAARPGAARHRQPTTCGALLLRLELERLEGEPAQLLLDAANLEAGPFFIAWKKQVGRALRVRAASPGSAASIEVVPTVATDERARLLAPLAQAATTDPGICRP